MNLEPGLSVSKALASARDSAFVAAIYLFFLGFSYRHFFYEYFGLPVRRDDSIYTTFVYAYQVLDDALIPLLIVAAALGIVRFASRKARGLRWYVSSLEWANTRFAGPIAFIAYYRIPVIVLIAFPISALFAQYSARKEAYHYRFALGPDHAVSSVVLNDTKLMLDSLTPPNDLYLITSTDDSFYFLRQHRPALDGVVPRGDIIQVSRGSVASMTIRLPSDPP